MNSRAIKLFSRLSSHYRQQPLALPLWPVGLRNATVADLSQNTEPGDSENPALVASTKRIPLKIVRGLAHMPPTPLRQIPIARSQRQVPTA